MAMMFQGGGHRAQPQPFDRRPGPIDWSTDLPIPTPSFAPMPSTPPVVAPKPSFFGEGGTGRTIAGVLGDTLLRMGGAAPIYAPMMQANRAREQHLVDEQRRAALELNTWKAKQAYEQAHPNDQFTQYLTAGGIDPASAQGRSLYRQRAESMAAPPLVAVDGFDPAGNPTKTFMPRTGLGGGNPAAPAIPDAAVSFLRQNPGMAAQFDQKYGQGASSRYLGGAAPAATSPFVTP